jgi:ribose 1,5-bisphosphokinase PhnN
VADDVHVVWHVNRLAFGLNRDIDAALEAGAEAMDITERAIRLRRPTRPWSRRTCSPPSARSRLSERCRIAPARRQP